MFGRYPDGGKTKSKNFGFEVKHGLTIEFILKDMEERYSEASEWVLANFKG